MANGTTSVTTLATNATVYTYQPSTSPTWTKGNSYSLDISGLDYITGVVVMVKFAASGGTYLFDKNGTKLTLLKNSTFDSSSNGIYIQSITPTKITFYCDYNTNGNTSLKLLRMDVFGGKA